MEGHEDMLRAKAKVGSAMTGATPGHQRRLEQDDKKSDRSTLLCFDASREGFLWLSRYICFPFLLVVLFSALGTAWHYVYVPWQIFDNTMLLLFVAGIHMLSIFVLYLLFKTSLTPAGHVPLDWVRL